jgi:hypothetical protein
MSESPQVVKIMRDEQVIGEYSLPEVLRLLADGTLRTSDYYRHNGMLNWIKLSELQDEERARAKTREDQLVAEAVKVRLAEQEGFNQRVDERVRSRLAERLAEARSKLAKKSGLLGQKSGLLGGVWFVCGVCVVFVSIDQRDKAQSAGSVGAAISSLFGSEYVSDSSIGSIGHEFIALVFGAIALLGLALIIAGLVRRK